MRRQSQMIDRVGWPVTLVQAERRRGHGSARTPTPLAHRPRSLFGALSTLGIFLREFTHDRRSTA